MDLEKEIARDFEEIFEMLRIICRKTPGIVNVYSHRSAGVVWVAVIIGIMFPILFSKT